MDLPFVTANATALGLGILIGLERQWRQHPSSLRTNALVALGSSLFVSLARMDVTAEGPTHIAAQVVSGLGFLGGGVILRDGFSVTGLSTAATLWCAGAIGILAGCGHLVEAATGTAFILAANLVLRPLAGYVNTFAQSTSGAGPALYEIRIECPPRQDRMMRALLLEHLHGNTRLNLCALTTDAAGQSAWTVVATVTAAQRADKDVEDLIAHLGIEPGVRAVTWKHAPQAPG